MLRKTSVLLLGIMFPLVAEACGPWFPEQFLSNGGQKILDAPEFYFELEMKQLASNYPTPLKADVNAQRQSPENGMPQQTPSLSTNQPILPTREAELYKKGAEAFKVAHLDEARSAWKNLLALPEEERRSFSISAAYMLGRADIDRPFLLPGAIKEESVSLGNPTAIPSPTPHDPVRDEEAVGYLRQVRVLAQKGFADPDGLAVASLGWEAYVELHRGDYEKAATLYLLQLSAGDQRAVNSLSFLASKLTDDAASTSLLRRLRTAEILCYGGGGSDAWLAALEKHDVDRVEEADRLAWMAYSQGKYDQAKHWLKRSDPNTGLALWLRAKLLMREGKVSEAASLMANAIQKIPSNAEVENSNGYEGRPMPALVAAGDLGMVLLAHGDFKEAFHAFFRGGHWNDAAYVAERVLTAGELKTIVDQEFKPSPEDETPSTQREDYGWFNRQNKNKNRVAMRWLLARRLTRDGELSEARPYFPVGIRPVLDRYADDLKRAHNKNAKPEERARAFFDAALIARNKGMELMGTEVEPDFEIYEGEYDGPDVVAERLRGKYLTDHFNPKGGELKKVVLPVLQAERNRLVKNAVEPEKRFHYRYTAANLAWCAAKILPNNSEITADVLNTAGTWLKERDEAAADRFLQAIERRCPETDIGKAVLKKHWFTDQQGPWSTLVQVY